MKSVWTRLSTAALAALLFAGARAHADFTYTNTIAPTQIQGSNGSLSFAASSATFSVTNGTTSGFTNWTPVIGSGLTTSSDTYSNAGYQVTLTINGAPSPQFVFNGVLNGTFTSSGISTLNSQLQDPSNSNALTSGQVVESQVINGVNYTVTLNANWPIGAQGNASTSLEGEIAWGASTGNSGNPGNPGNGGGTQNSPEPSTMLLSFVGLSCLSASAWRRKRKTAAHA